MLISFSGAQSTGKTTLLNHLREKNIHISFVPEVTRLIKREYNLPINEDGTNVTQLMIMSEHMRNAYAYSDQSKAILDRCALDGLVYTRWLFEQGKVKSSVLEVAHTICSEIISRYDLIFYTSPNDVSLVDDGERSVDVNFRSDIIKLFDNYLPLLTNVVVLSGSVEQRLKTIKMEIESRNLASIII
jgi:nicotinamide riboside kinase